MDDPHGQDAAVETLDEGAAAECIEVLSAAFAHEPTLRYVIDDAGPTFAERLRSLVTFFVTARVLRREPMLGVRDGGRLVGAAIVSYPWRQSPHELDDVREDLWHELGPATRRRYQEVGEAAARFGVGAPHLHLNMLGVLPVRRGGGIGARLVEAVQELSRREPASHGVALVAGGEANARYYRRLRFAEVGRAGITPGLDVAVFFREDRAS